MLIRIEDFIQIATQTKRKSTKTLRGKLEQFALVIPNSLREECFDLLSNLPQKQNKWIIAGENRPMSIQIVSQEAVTAVQITETRVYESRLAALDEPDPRRVAMIKKKITDARAGKMPGTSISLLKELLAESQKIPLRTAIERKIAKELAEDKAKAAFKNLEKVSHVLITNYETAPTRLRFTWKGSDGQYHSLALSSGISIVFEAPMLPSSKGWISDTIELAREQDAWVKGVYFPREISELGKRKRKQKIKDDPVP